MRTQTGSIDRELYWELLEPEPERRRRRAARLAVTYALADPDGWDARRLADTRSWLGNEPLTEETR